MDKTKQERRTIVKNITLEKLCGIVGIACPVDFPADMRFVDVLGSPIAARDGSAVFIWRSNPETGKAHCEEALKKKAGIVFCHQHIKEQSFADEKRVVGVDNPVECITRYIWFVRHSFNAKVVTVTGSVGKTTTTDMLQCVIGNDRRLFRGGQIDNSRGAIIRLTQRVKDNDEVFLQEVGAAEPGHVDSLARGLCPDVAVITNIGYPHLDYYKTQENILKDKATLVENLTEDGAAFFDIDNELLRNYQTEKRVITYAIDNKDADYYAENIVADEKCQQFDIVCNQKQQCRYHVTINVLGQHNVRNALAAFAVGEFLNIPASHIVKSLLAYQPEGQRQNLTTVGGYRVFLDMFNSAPDSLIGAVKILENVAVEDGGRRIVVISDIVRLGLNSAQIHRKLGEDLADCEFDCLWCLGKDMENTYAGLKSKGRENVFHTEDQQVLNEWLRENVTRKDVVLYKGSQKVTLAKTVDELYGTTYYHGNQGVFVSNEEVAISYKHIGEYLECGSCVNKQTKNVHIQERIGDKEVRRIAPQAFTECRQLEEVIIPDTVLNIGKRAFYICPKLERVTLSKNLKIIESSAFNYCRKLKEVRIPEGTISIGERAFYDCSSLEWVEIPASVAFIGNQVFANCPKVVVKVIEDSYAHQYCVKNKVPFVIYGGVAVVRGNPCRKGELTYEKEANDYRFEVHRTKPSGKGRYVQSGRIWQKKTGTDKKEAVLMCAGDLMCEPIMSEVAYCDGEYFFQPFFKRVKKILEEGDLAIANLETMVTELYPYAHEMHVLKHRTGPRYHCNAPTSYLDALRFAGFDAFALSNNHNADCGYDGIVDMLKNLQKKEFMTTGLFEDENADRTLVVDINGIKVGILSYTEHINRRMDEEILTPYGREVMLNRFTRARLEKDVRLARDKGAEFMICYIHFLGNDYSHIVAPKNMETAQIIADCGIDCIMGSHMHAVQKYDILTSCDGRKVPVVYSLGNFISSDSHSIAKSSIIYRLVLAKDENGVRIKDESYIPCRVVDPFQNSSFTIFPTQVKYRKRSTSNLLDKAEREIRSAIGDKLRIYE